LVVLDESLAALDPENFRQCLECILRRAPTLILIAQVTFRRTLAPGLSIPSCPQFFHSFAITYGAYRFLRCRCGELGDRTRSDAHVAMHMHGDAHVAMHMHGDAD
jgi:hypothetical protein